MLNAPSRRSSKRAASSVVPELQQPIERLKTAIESRLPSKIEEQYPRYDQDEPTKKYLSQIINTADSVHVASITFQESNVRGNTAQVNFKMLLNVNFNGSKQPMAVGPSSWRADLVRDGVRAPWKLQKLTPQFAGTSLGQLSG